MSKAMRHRMVEELAKELKDRKSLMLVDAQGMTGNQTVELRADLREGEAGFRHVKNSVALHAFKKLGIEGFEDKLSGMNGFAFGGDAVAIAKKLVAFREKSQRGGVKAALVEGKVLGPAEVEAYSKLPSREELLATFFGTLKAVTQKFVATLNEVPRSFVGTLQAVADKDKKE